MTTGEIPQKKSKEIFLKEIENFVDEYVNSHASLAVDKSGKVIHDALWGTQKIYSHELCILDTPLIQRLRQIKQTAFAYLIFPSATHTRFEHTLGVLFQSTKLINALKEKYRDLIAGDEDLIRMGALLHDCGHGPFSHSSEEIYKNFSDMKDLIGPGGDHEECTPHEVMSYYIIKSPPFKDFFSKITQEFTKKIDIDEVAELIIGTWDKPATKYLADIINGPFDADKLDYLFRDGHFSGLPLKVDLDRLWYSVQIHNPIKDKPELRMLVTSINGTVPLEQIIFSKMVLFTSLYHHHKARACDCMLKAILEYCKEKGEKICDKDLSKSTDFLWVTDDKVYAEADTRRKTDPLHRLIHDLKFRRLFKRALVISKATVKDGSKDFFGYGRLKQFCSDLKDKDPELRKLAQRICDEAKVDYNPYEVWVDLPKLPPIGLADDTYVNIGTFEAPNFVRLKDIFSVDDWAQAYAEHNWKGFVFCPDSPDTDKRKKISEAAKKIIENEFNIQFDRPSTDLCKI